MICTTLNYIEHCLILAFAIAGCILISAFASLLGIPTGFTSSAIGSKLCAIVVGIKKYSSIIKKKKKKHNKILLLAKSKLNSEEVIKALIGSNISHDAFVLINNVLSQYDDMKEEMKNIKT